MLCYVVSVFSCLLFCIFEVITINKESLVCLNLSQSDSIKAYCIDGVVNATVRVFCAEKPGPDAGSDHSSVELLLYKKSLGFKNTSKNLNSFALSLVIWYKYLWKELCIALLFASVLLESYIRIQKYRKLFLTLWSRTTFFFKSLVLLQILELFIADK